MMNLDWDDFYDGSFTPFNGGRNPSNGQFYAHDCTFSGGTDRAISFISFKVHNKLLIESSSFTDYFKIYKPGPAVDFVYEGQCCLNRVCGKNCSTSAPSYLGHFSEMIVTDEFKKKNFLNSSTVFSCGDEYKGGSACDFQHGCFSLSNTNISECKAIQTSSFRSHFPYSPLCLLSSFANCTSGENSVIRFESCKEESKINKCNVVNNFSPNIVHALRGKPCTVEEDIFIGNNIGPLFYGQENVIKIVKCFIGDNKCDVGSEGVNTNLISTNQFALNFDYLSTVFCESSNPDQNQDHRVAKRFIYEGSLDIVCALRFNCNTRHEHYLYLIDVILHGTT